MAKNRMKCNLIPLTYFCQNYFSWPWALSMQNMTAIDLIFPEISLKMVKVGQWYQITIWSKLILCGLILGKGLLLYFVAHISTVSDVQTAIFPYFAKLGQRSLSALKSKSDLLYCSVKTTPCWAQILLIFALRATV